jgi:dTDP-glucose pyrophosphorylase/predicted transcriptional regulator
VSAENFRSVLVHLDTSIRDTYRVMDESALMIALVVDEVGKLLGTVTDGDIRRGLLKGMNLDTEIRAVLNPRPVSALIGTSASDVIALMNLHHVAQIPLLDEQGIVIGLELMADLVKKSEKITNPAFILAGGFGRRLQPLTSTVPKPMLPIGGKPLLELIIERLAAQGFQSCYLAVHYLEDVIRKCIGDGARFGIEIHYVQESEPMGTIGALRLIAKEIRESIVVVNGDLFTSLNLQHLLKFHQMGGQHMTLALRHYSHQVPYGVVKLQGETVVAIEEKPLQSNFVSAGMAVIDLKPLSLIPPHGPFDMPDFIRSALANGYKVAGFPIHETWVDIGTPEEYERADQVIERVPGNGNGK